MKSALPVVLMLVALIVTVFSIIGEGGFSQVESLEQRLAERTQLNAELEKYVGELKEKGYQIRNNDRELEKTARDELGLAKPGEILFFFEDDQIVRTENGESSSLR